QRITIAGVVTASKTKTTKNNSLMAYVTVEDDTASMELLCFSRVLENYGSYLKENQAIVIKGKLSVRDEKTPQILCDQVVPLQASDAPEADAPPTAEEKRDAQKTLYLRFESAQSPAFAHCKLVFSMFPGKTPVRMRMVDSGKLLGTQCLLHPALLQELRETVGEKNVVVQ
ncbi:MAG: OB-fold nucleic acid binding domain-containing protein, partial [Ruthenibacterium sp.]